jgi:hypothetical protein
MKHSESRIARFARHVLGKPLYPYQCEVANAILDSIEGWRGRIITVMMARQSGKNQLSAVLEAYLLMTRPQALSYALGFVKTIYRTYYDRHKYADCHDFAVQLTLIFTSVWSFLQSMS